MKKQNERKNLIYYIQNIGVVLIGVLLIPVGIFAVLIWIVWNLIDNVINFLELKIRK